MKKIECVCGNDKFFDGYNIVSFEVESEVERYRVYECTKCRERVRVPFPKVCEIKLYLESEDLNE